MKTESVSISSRESLEAFIKQSKQLTEYLEYELELWFDITTTHHVTSSSFIPLPEILVRENFESIFYSNNITKITLQANTTEALSAFADFCETEAAHIQKIKSEVFANVMCWSNETEDGDVFAVYRRIYNAFPANISFYDRVGSSENHSLEDFRKLLAFISEIKDVLHVKMHQYVMYLDGKRLAELLAFKRNHDINNTMQFRELILNINGKEILELFEVIINPQHHRNIWLVFQDVDDDDMRCLLTAIKNSTQFDKLHFSFKGNITGGGLESLAQIAHLLNAPKEMNIYTDRQCSDVSIQLLSDALRSQPIRTKLALNMTGLNNSQFKTLLSIPSPKPEQPNGFKLNALGSIFRGGGGLGTRTITSIIPLCNKLATGQIASHSSFDLKNMSDIIWDFNTTPVLDNLRPLVQALASSKFPNNISIWLPANPLTEIESIIKTMTEQHLATGTKIVLCLRGYITTGPHINHRLNRYIDRVTEIARAQLLNLRFPYRAGVCISAGYPPMEETLERATLSYQMIYADAYRIMQYLTLPALASIINSYLVDDMTAQDYNSKDFHTKELVARFQQLYQQQHRCEYPLPTHKYPEIALKQILEHANTSSTLPRRCSFEARILAIKTRVLLTKLLCQDTPRLPTKTDGLLALWKTRCTSIALPQSPNADQPSSKYTVYKA